MPMTKDLSHLLPQVIEIARSAGQMILEIYEKTVRGLHKK